MQRQVTAPLAAFAALAALAALPAAAYECRIEVQCLGSYNCVRDNGWALSLVQRVPGQIWLATDEPGGSETTYIPIRDVAALDGTLFLISDDDADSQVTILTLQPEGALAITVHSTMPSGISSTFFGSCED